MPQFSENRKYKIDSKDFDIGLGWFVLGLAKKVLLADTIARFADSMFAQPHGVSFFSAWSGVLAYALQLYFDFSGYSDMAVGLARMFSIQFPLNFNSPYKASSIIDFWQRWHMTLTRYITLYLYNPVSMWIARRRIASGKSTSRKALATPLGFASMLAFPTMFTMLLAGIWHGAGLQFLIYGVLHGCYITINHVWRVFGPKLTTPVKWIRRVGFVSGVALTFIAVMVAQVFFRADSTQSALSVIAGMTGLHGFGHSHVLGDFSLASGWQSFEKPLLIVFMLSIVWAAPNTQKLMSYYPSVRIPGQLKAVAYGILGYVILYHTTTQSFIYFQF
jgi:alginate O-acetyltransferase complex protein AlgI